MLTRRAFTLLIPALALAESATLPSERLRRIEQVISTEMARATIPGLNVAIAMGSDVRWSNGYGLADLENTVPMTARTVIRLGSISKPITATAVMQLVERGKFRLDAPIQEYVPQFPQKQWPVTVRQLLGHLGGIRHYQDEEISSTRHYLNRMDPLRIFSADPLLQEPGTKYVYSTYGFNLLGAAVESVTGTPFPDYLRTFVFRPAGMDATRDDDVYAVIPHRSRGYALLGTGQVINCGLADTSNKVPGGGMIGPASDLVRFGMALTEGKLLKSASVDQMLSSQTLKDGRSTGYGMGFTCGVTNGRKFASHGGGQQGTSTYLLLFPADRIAIAVMANREAAPVGSMADQIAAIVLEP